MKEVLQRWAPPAVLEAAAHLFKRRLKFYGPYIDWKQASVASTGYEDPRILEKAKQAMLKIKNGEAVGERDTILFSHIPYSFPMLSCLLRVALAEDGSLRVLDFGGSLGSSYLQCREFLREVRDLRWAVVEQPDFVVCGQALFSDETLKFYHDFNTCLAQEQPNLILLSSVLQYLEEPYVLVEKIKYSNASYVLFDRTPCAPDGKEVLTVQVVPPKIYSASYPAWIFDSDKLMRALTESYDLLLEFDANDGCIRSGSLSACYKGFFLRRCKR
jgi:putative methyltransferase (TIGR04325 family)